MLSNEPNEHSGGDIAHRRSSTDERGAESVETMELREEELRARKESVEAGRVTLGKEVVSEQRTLEVPVTREEVTIERHAVNREPASGQIGDDKQSINVPVREERVTADKQAVVYEEVQVGKQAVQETQRVSGTVRREEARIEGDGDLDVKRDA